MSVMNINNDFFSQGLDNVDSCAIYLDSISDPLKLECGHVFDLLYCKLAKKQ